MINERWLLVFYKTAIFLAGYTFAYLMQVNIVLAVIATFAILIGFDILYDRARRHEKRKRGLFSMEDRN